MKKTDLDMSNQQPFSERLQSLIDDPESGILLDANVIWNKRQREKKASSETAVETQRAAFELASGRFQRKFVTLWELFDHPEEFEICLNELTEVAEAFDSLKSRLKKLRVKMNPKEGTGKVNA